MTRLGRGLMDLIPAIDPTKMNEVDGVREVSLKSIYPSELQPRKYFKDSDLRSLADSIKQHGLVQPILVRKTEKGYEIIAGERRFRACLLAKKVSVSVCVRDVDDQTVLQLAIVENLQRKNLSVLELVQGYQRLMDVYGLKQDELSKIFNKSRATIANQLRLLNLPKQVLNMLNDHSLKEGHARAILGFQSEQDRINMANTIVEKNLSVREVEALVKVQKAKDSTQCSSVYGLDNYIRTLNENECMDVSVVDQKGVKSLQIQCSDEKELVKLLQKITT